MSSGLAVVREAIKQHYSQQEAPADAEELKVVGSSFECLSLCLPACLPPPHVAADLHQCSSHPWWSRAESGGS